jgi:hypothetical protein
VPPAALCPEDYFSYSICSQNITDPPCERQYLPPGSRENMFLKEEEKTVCLDCILEMWRNKRD